RVSCPEVSPICLWTGSPGVTFVFRVWGCLAHVCDPHIGKLLARTLHCVLLGFPVNDLDFTLYNLSLYWFFDSRNVTFDKSVSFYAHYPHQGLPDPPPPPTPPHGPAPPVILPHLGAGSGCVADKGAGARAGGAGSEGADVGSTGAGGAPAGGAAAAVLAPCYSRRFKLQQQQNSSRHM
ncbi:unnamed protein product, partial [Closterium sp. NIES-53]